MLIQIHILQNYAPANLNRDDSGSPKDAYFGGMQRGRISSQCLKRSMRTSLVFEEAFKEKGLLADRTKLLPDEIGKYLAAKDVDTEIVGAIVARASEIGRKGREKDESEPETPEEEADARPQTKQLIFLGKEEVPLLADKMIDLYQEMGAKKFAKEDIRKLEATLAHELPRSVDVAMFGRMTTSQAFENVQAAVQVAHALSTNTLRQEYDYYTAVDDLSGQTGAGMIGDTEFNSSTYYKYVNVHWEQLLQNLGGDTESARQAVLALVEAAVIAQPSGKQNTFANHNLPDLILLEVRARNLPVSYANAFLTPARQQRGGETSLMDDSVVKLSDYIARIRKTYALNGRNAYTAVQDYSLPDSEQQDSLPALLGWLVTQLPKE